MGRALSALKLEYSADHGGSGDKDNGMELLQLLGLHTQEDSYGQGDRGPVEGKGVLRSAAHQQEYRNSHAQPSGGNQPGRGGAQAVKDGVHRLGLAEFLEEAGDDDDNYDGDVYKRQPGDAHP